MKLIIYFIIIHHNLFHKKLKNFFNFNRFLLNIKFNMKSDYKFILKNSVSQ